MYSYKLFQLFPNAKFIFMIRDGRAAAYSKITALKQEAKFETFKKYLHQWKGFNEIALIQCNKIGSNNCLKIRYEDLVLHTEEILRKVIKFLDLEWNTELLRHHLHIDREVNLAHKGVWNMRNVVSYLNLIIYMGVYTQRKNKLLKF